MRERLERVPSVRRCALARNDEADGGARCDRLEARERQIVDDDDAEPCLRRLPAAVDDGVRKARASPRRRGPDEGDRGREQEE